MKFLIDPANLRAKPSCKKNFCTVVVDPCSSLVVICPEKLYYPLYGIPDDEI